MPFFNSKGKGVPRAPYFKVSEKRSQRHHTALLAGPWAVACLFACIMRSCVLVQVIVILGGTETPEFWFYIGGFGEISRGGTMGEAALKAELPSPRAAQSDLSERNARPRVAIIGAGVAGCAAANYLQRNNVNCVLFEVLNEPLMTMHPILQFYLP